MHSWCYSNSNSYDIYTEFLRLSPFFLIYKFNAGFGLPFSSTHLAKWVGIQESLHT